MQMQVRNCRARMVVVEATGNSVQTDHRGLAWILIEDYYNSLRRTPVIFSG